MSQTPLDLRALSRSSETTLKPIGGRGPALVPKPRTKWRTRVLVPMAVILATGGVLAYAARDVLRPRIPVYVTSVVPKPMSINHAEAVDDTQPPTQSPQGSAKGPVLVQAPGWAEPAPFATIVPALADGVIERVLVLEGEHVEEGQVVATMIARDAELTAQAAQSALAQRRADVEVAKAELATAIARIDVERAVVAELRDDVTRKSDLVTVGGVSIGEFRRLEIRLTGAEAMVVASERKVDEAKSAVSQREAAVTAAAVVVEEAALRLARMEIRSPVSGVVLSRQVEPGSRISMSSNSGSSADGGGMSGVVLRVYDPATLQVRVDVPLADTAKVTIGTRATITTEALPDSVFEGVVSRIVHEADIQRNTVQFKVDIAAPSPVMKPEMLMRVKFYGHSGGTHASSVQSGDDEREDLDLHVPVSALHGRSGDSASVWVVDVSTGSEVATLRSVSTLPAESEGFVVVRSGLRITDRLIVDPPATIHEGSRLRVLGERTPATTSEANDGGEQ